MGPAVIPVTASTTTTTTTTAATTTTATATPSATTPTPVQISAGFVTQQLFNATSAAGLNPLFFPQYPPYGVVGGQTGLGGIPGPTIPISGTSGNVPLLANRPIPFFLRPFLSGLIRPGASGVVGIGNFPVVGGVASPAGK